LHENTIIEAKPESAIYNGDRYSIDGEERRDSEFELKNLEATPSSKRSDRSRDASPVPTPNGGLSDSDVKRTITDFLSMKHEEAVTSRQDSVPKLLRHFSYVSARSPPPTALSRPLTSSTRPVTPSTQPVTSQNTSNDEKKSSETNHRDIGQKG